MLHAHKHISKSAVMTLLIKLCLYDCKCAYAVTAASISRVMKD